jgi:hypothetical protein
MRIDIKRVRRYLSEIIKNSQDIAGEGIGHVTNVPKACPNAR